MERCTSSSPSTPKSGDQWPLNHFLLALLGLCWGEQKKTEVRQLGPMGFHHIQWADRQWTRKMMDTPYDTFGENIWKYPITYSRSQKQSKTIYHHISPQRITTKCLVSSHVIDGPSTLKNDASFKAPGPWHSLPLPARPHATGGQAGGGQSKFWNGKDPTCANICLNGFKWQKGKKILYVEFYYYYHHHQSWSR